ncbi:hypothetical protein RCZ04_20320 [Capnocytophaga sp. HP1101]
MLKVAFPVGEFFHNHHTQEELCTIATGDTCHHDSHLSAVDTHHDCIFLQLHQFFAPSFFTYQFLEQNVVAVFFFIEKGIPQTAFAIFSRGPPVNLVVSR